MTQAHYTALKMNEPQMDTCMWAHIQTVNAVWGKSVPKEEMPYDSPTVGAKLCRCAHRCMRERKQGMEPPQRLPRQGTVNGATGKGLTGHLSGENGLFLVINLIYNLYSLECQ